MIDIYNEVNYIKSIISNGLSQKWERDIALLVRYYKEYEGKKKAWITKEIKYKCSQAASRPDDPIIYDPDNSFRRTNKIINSSYNKSLPLREITSVTITKPVLDWFLSLETSYTISDETLAFLKRRKGVSVKSNKPINWNRTKYLFTLYIWTLIQQNYLDKPDMHYLKKYTKRFKEDANLPDSFNLKRERYLLEDLGFIKMNFSLGIQTVFMSNFPVFSVQTDDKITISIKDETTTINGKEYLIEAGDLHNPGYWLEKQKYGTFICQECGKEFAHYSKTPREQARKYCKECAKKIGHNNRELEEKEITCIDCGKVFKVDKRDSHSVRCYSCQAKHKNNLNKSYYKRKTYDDVADYLILGEPLDL